jgi:hypothetical protein
MARVAAAVLCAVVATGAPGAPASGQAPSTASITLVEQPAWTPVGAVMAMRLHPDDVPAGSELRFVMHPALSTRTGFEQTVEGTALGPAGATVRVPLGALPVGSNGDVTVALGIGEASPATSVLPVEGTGVHPLSVSVGPPGGDALDEFVTWVVAVDRDPVPDDLRVAWIWSIASTPLLDRAGAPAPDVASEMAPEGRLADIARLLELASDVPLTLRVSPQTLAAWSALAEVDRDYLLGLASVRDAVERRAVEVLAAPYVPLDMGALEAGALGNLVGEAALNGIDAIQRELGVRVDPRTALVEHPSDAVLRRLHTLFVDRLVVAPDSLVPVERRLTPARPFAIDVDDTTFRAVSTDAGLERLLTRVLDSPEPPALRAQRFLAGVSLVALEAPGRQRGVVVGTPLLWSAESPLVRFVLEGLRDHPLVSATTVDALFADVPDDTVDDSAEPLVRELADDESTIPAFTVGEFATLRSDLDSFASIVGRDDALVARGEEALRVAPSSLLAPPQARAELDLVHAEIDRVLDAVQVREGSLTLTAREAEIPLSFTNDTGQPVTVRMVLESPKLLFPQGSEHVVELGEGNTTMRFPVEARASGAFTMTVTLSAPTGRLELGTPARIRIRSTVFSGVGVAMTVGAVGFLVLWWGNHLRTNRRARRAPADAGA